MGRESTETTLEKTKARSKPLSAVLVMFGGLLLLGIALVLSILYGAAQIDLQTVRQAIFQFDSSVTEHQIIHDIRIPRALGAALVGSFLAVSGAIMQGMTRNPLAEPSIMGVMDGAALAIAIMFAFSASVSGTSLMFAAFIGAGAGAAFVFMIGSLARGGLSPAKLALAGVTVGAFLSAISSGIAIYFNVSQDISFWFAGGLAGMSWANIRLLIPVAIVGLLLALFLSRSVTVMSLGEDVAKGLGQRIFIIKVLGVIVVLLLTGAGVAVAGAIGFIGLVIPHITRGLVGVDYRFIIPCSAVLGALLLVMADLASRLVNAPFETPVGAMTALIGVPFFLYLARREGRGLK
ncbi:ABC-type Fe3+-siderophore transport system, permease component [Bacillus sp. JCM 19045]|uniref:Iron complex transport system permease protein n=2 Tax=Shouchella xiaoxiensis TaxID=766895 RepID=A0ABS2SV02_9BACI|nr:iron complex transport system permease protein [Shouchella xiaoxiensis]GAF13550.1 ABC-type Fe3+-siderophore transport system, permease component [Bacillus sp. JCM 19045]